MNAKELLILNFEEVRRRSIKLWKNIPEENLYWKPDTGAMSCFEMIRHVLESENIYHQIILNRGDLGNYESPLTGNPYTSIDDELKIPGEIFKNDTFIFFKRVGRGIYNPKGKKSAP